MKELEKRMTDLVHETDELRKLLIENPGVPLVIFAGKDASLGDYGYTSCSRAAAYKGEILDCMQEINKEKLYIDRAEFEDDLYDYLYEYYEMADSYDGTDDNFEAYFKNHLKEYEPYWKDAIILFVNN